MKMVKPPDGKLERITDKYVIKGNCPLEPCVSKNNMKYRCYFISIAPGWFILVLSQFTHYLPIYQDIVSKFCLFFGFVLMFYLIRIVTSRINEHIEYMEEQHKMESHILKKKDSKMKRIKEWFK